MVFIILVATILVAVGIEVLFLRKKRALAHVNEHSSSPVVFNRSSLEIPEGYHFSPGHTWAKEDSGKLNIGIDAFVLKALGNLKIDKLTPAGNSIKKGDVIFEATANSKRVKFRSPVDGKNDFVNNKIIGKQLTDVYGENWGVKVTAGSDQIARLLSDGAALDWMKSEFRRLKDFLSFNSFKAEPIGATMYDGGNVVEGVVSDFDEDLVVEFEENFLTF